MKAGEPTRCSDTSVGASNLARVWNDRFCLCLKTFSHAIANEPSSHYPFGYEKTSTSVNHRGARRHRRQEDQGDCLSPLPEKLCGSLCPTRRALSRYVLPLAISCPPAGFRESSGVARPLSWIPGNRATTCSRDTSIRRSVQLNWFAHTELIIGFWPVRLDGVAL